MTTHHSHRSHPSARAAGAIAAAAMVLSGCSGTGSEPSKPAPKPSELAPEPSKPAPETSETASEPVDASGPIVFRRFLNAANTQAALFTMQADGTGSRQLTRPPDEAIDSLPDWSPDGKRIVFHREFTNKPYEVYTISADGTDQQQVDPGCPPGVSEDAGEICEETDPAWSPDGKLIAFSWPHGRVGQVGDEDTIDVRGIGVMGVEGTGAKLITQTRRPTSSEDETPTWAPDGRRIAFVRLNISAEPQDATALFVANADGSEERQITPWTMNAADPAWSPDGELISFRSEDPNTDFTGEIHTVHPDGSGMKRLTRAGGNMVYGSTFSPDGSRIVFAMTGQGAQPDLFVMDRDGSNLEPLTRTPEWDSAPDWRPR